MSSIINQDSDRTFVYEDSIFQFIDAGGNKTLEFIKNWTFAPSMGEFDIDLIDTAAPIYTKKNDILGTFSFNTVNTVDFYDPGSAAQPSTYAFWATQIAIGEPPSVTFLVTMKAPKSTGNKFARIQFIGRIMSPPLSRVDETGVHQFTVNGEITSITSITRTVT